MKIGVLTYVREYSNLGTVMQSFSTLQAVQRAYPGARVELVDYAACRPLMRPYLSQATLKSLKNDCARFLKYRRFFRTEFTFSKERMFSANLQKSLEFIRKQNYDAIFVGADTLLELKDPRNGELTPFWLDSTVGGCKFMVAASSHNVVYETLSDRQKEKMQKTVDDFKLLGVRDDPTFRLLSHFVKNGDDRLRMIPDPTFTYQIDYRHVERYMRKRGFDLRQPMVCLHLLKNTAWASDLSDRFRKEGYLVASLRPARYADVIFTDLAPHEQMGLYRYFDLVITHRFHDSIFSIKNLTPAIFFPEHASDVTKHGESKTVALFRTFGLEKTAYVADSSQCNSEYLYQIHREVISQFAGKREAISRTLGEQARKYQEFIELSKRHLL